MMNISFFKKGLASVALTGMLSVLFVSTASARLNFTDASEIPSWAEEAIGELVDQGVLNGNDDGTFAPNRQLNRAEVAKIIVMASGVDFDTYGGPHFPDVDESAWFYDYVETMYNYGWIDGYPDGLFRPANGINRAEIAKMTINAFEIEPDLAGAPHFDDVNSSDWFYSYVETAYNYGLMRGYSDGTFGAAKAVTRAETARVVYDSQLAVSEPEGPAEGTLEVVLSGDTPRGTNVPYNATSVPYTTVEFTASDDSDVEISSLTFTRLGLGDNDDFDSVWMEIDGFKVGNDKSINNDDIVELRFNPPVVVPAGQTLVADVVTSAKYTDNDKNIGHHNRLALVAADDIASTAQNIVGDFPIEGEEMQVADYEVSTVSFSKLGSDTTIDVGDNFIEIGKFRLENGSNTNKDVELRAMTFKNNGTAEIEDVLENVALYVSGEQVSAETIMDGDYMTFRLDNGVTGGYVIEDGDSRIFSLRADIVSAEKNDTINFKIDNFEDVVAIEIGTSFGVKAVTPAGLNAEDANATLAEYTIDSGDLNISRDPSSLGNQQYAPGSNDVVMLTARLVVDQPLLVDGVTLRASAATGLTNLAAVNAAFDNFRLFLNDKLIDSENDFALKTGGTDGVVTDYELVYNTTFEIAGASVMKLVTNIQNAAPDGATLKVSLTATDFASPEYISTGDTVADDMLLGSATGSFVEVTESILDIVRSDSLGADETIVAGVDDITMMKFILDNNDSGDVNVTSVTVDLDQGGAAGTCTGASTTQATCEAEVDVAAVKQVDTITKVGGSDSFSVADTFTVTVDGTAVTYTVVANDIAADDAVMFENFANAINGDATVSAIVTAAVPDKDSITLTAKADADFTATIADTAATEDLGISTTVPGTRATYHTWTAAATPTFSNYTVAIFVDGTQQGSSKNLSTANGTATFNDLSVVIPSAGQKEFVAVANTLEASAGDILDVKITAVDADNVENGSEVTVKNAGTTIATAPLTGTTFNLVAAGRLTVAAGSALSDDILVSGSDKVNIFEILFEAADDDMEIKDLYLENTLASQDFGAISDFYLYNEAGQLIQEKQMSGDSLHFELANQDRIRVAKDATVTVYVKVDINEINSVDETAKQLQLGFDQDMPSGTEAGLEVVTAATGSDVVQADGLWVTNGVKSDKYVAYKSEMSISYTDNYTARAGMTDLVDFTISADDAGKIDLAKLTFTVSLSNLLHTGGLDDGDIVLKDTNNNKEIVADATVTLSSGTTTGATVTIEFGTPVTITTSKTYTLAFDAGVVESVANQDSYSVTVDLVEDAAPAAADTVVNLAGSKVIWSDASSIGNADFLNGWQIKNANEVTVD